MNVELGDLEASAVAVWVAAAAADVEELEAYDPLSAADDALCAVGGFELPGLELPQLVAHWLAVDVGDDIAQLHAGRGEEGAPLPAWGSAPLRPLPRESRHHGLAPLSMTASVSPLSFS